MNSSPAEKKEDKECQSDTNVRKRLVEPADIKILYDMHVKSYINQFNNEPDFEGMALLCACWFGAPGEIAELAVLDPKLIAFLHASEPSKEGLMILIKEFLERGHVVRNTSKPDLPPLLHPPHAVIHSCEAWGATFGPEHGVKSYEEACDAFQASGLRIQDHPRRFELLMVNIYTEHEQFNSICPIRGEGEDRRMEYAPLDFTGTLRAGPMCMHEPMSHEAH